MVRPLSVVMAVVLSLALAIPDAHARGFLGGYGTDHSSSGHVQSYSRSKAAPGVRIPASCGLATLLLQ